MLTAAQVGLPIIEALGITGPVVSVTLRCQAGEVPTLDVRSYVMADGKFVFEPVNPNRVQEVLRRYRLVLCDDQEATS